MARHALLVLLIFAPFATTSAQTVRGIVKEQNSGLPLPGVLIALALDSDPGSAVATTLSNEQGAYSIRAPRAGRYVLGAKRIGVRRYTSVALDLKESQELQLDVELEALVYQLPTVTVHSEPLCVRRAEHAARVASLWDEASTALTATQVSLRDRLVRARVVRYVRDIHATSLRPEGDLSRRQSDGVMEQPFVSLPAEALSRNGYWRHLPNDSIAYYAPDATVLLSRSFARDHCFGVVEGRGDRNGLTGMEFEPERDRETPDVRGTIWLDARTFELRLVEFKYSRLPYPSNNRNVGGEVHFSRLPGGAWIVERWFIRMPRYNKNPTTRSTGIPGVAPIVEYRLTGLVEEGGTVDIATRPPSRN